MIVWDNATRRFTVIELVLMVLLIMVPPYLYPTITWTMVIAMAFYLGGVLDDDDDDWRMGQ